jgi:two-component system NtrC family response regulator
VERAVALTTDGPIEPDALLLDTSLSPATGPSLAQLSRRPRLRELTDEYVTLVLQEAGGDKARAAEILGISKRTLYRWDRQPTMSSDPSPEEAV